MNNLQEILKQLDEAEIKVNETPTGLVSKQLASQLLQDLEIKMLNDANINTRRTDTPRTTSKDKARIINLAKEGATIIPENNV
jgi:hypothetical protein